jgi:hypothetical protein
MGCPVSLSVCSNRWSRAQDLAAKPDAARWGGECAWVPGTGHCRNRDCDTACIFRHQRDAEAARVRRWRRLRRMFLRRQVR